MRAEDIKTPSNILLGIIWFLSLVSIFVDLPILKMLNGLILIAYISLVVWFIRRSLKILCLILGVITIAIATATDGWHWAWSGIEKATLFSAFFGTLSLLRSTADARPEIQRASLSVERLSGAERDSGLLVGTFFLGSTLIVGVMAIFAPIVGEKASLESRKNAAEACQRGMCLACLWSPFWVAMAISSEHLPNVPLWQIILSGLSLATLGLITAQILYTPRVGLRALLRAIISFYPVLPPVTLTALVVLALNGFTTLSTLQCLVLGVPALCVTGLAFMGLEKLLRSLKEAGEGLGTIQGEIVLLTTSFALGRLLQFLLETEENGNWMNNLSLAPYAIISFGVAFMTLLAFIGIHQIVTLTIVLVAFTNPSFGIDQLVLMQTGLLGWAFASMIGLSAVSVAAASTMFRVPLEQLAYGSNVKFVFIFGFIGVATILLMNEMLT
ncbi:MAG: hypothetical protein VW445_04190 [Rhodospirillaceae bacterium]